MKPARLVCAGLILVALTAGTLADRSQSRPPLWIGGYRVLAADFHVHSYPLSGSTLAPWDLVLEARRQSLDAIAITGHNQVEAGLLGRWFARLVGGPTVIVGEEIHAPGYHMIAAGIRSTIGWRNTAAESIAEIHRQGGVAIAAHPIRSFWPAFDLQAMATLDATEIMQPTVYGYRYGARDMREFYQRSPLAAIGSSDYHGVGPLGICRTYVFAQDDSERSILEAVRQRRTVVYDGDGRAWGDPALIRLAADRLRNREPKPSSILDLFSRACGLLGLAGFLISGNRAVYSGEEKRHIVPSPAP
jgi:hypothetical protein